MKFFPLFLVCVFTSSSLLDSCHIKFFPDRLRHFHSVQGQPSPSCGLGSHELCCCSIRSQCCLWVSASHPHSHELIWCQPSPFLFRSLKFLCVMLLLGSSFRFGTFDLGPEFGDLSSSSDTEAESDLVLDALMNKIASAHQPHPVNQNLDSTNVIDLCADCDDYSSARVVIDLCDSDSNDCVGEKRPNSKPVPCAQFKTNVSQPQIKFCRFYATCNRTDLAHYFEFAHPYGFHGKGIIR